MKKTAKSKKRIVRKIVLFLLLAIVVAGAGLYGYSALRQEYTVTYNSYTATTGSISNTLSFSGNMSLVDSATYTSPAAATVRTLYVTPGDMVKEDDKLLRLSNGTTVRAEFDGRVNTVGVQEGDEVVLGQNLIQVADFTHLRISMRIDEYDISDVAVGQKCTVTVTANEKKYDSEIATIDYISASAGNVAYYTAIAYVDVDSDTLPGMQVTVSVPQEEATDVVILKADALSFDAMNQGYVWMKNASGEMEQVYVKTGVSNGNYVEITEGLADGDEVFVEAKKEESSALNGLLSGLFGNQQFNGGMPENMSGNMPGGFNGGERSFDRSSGMGGGASGGMSGGAPSGMSGGASGGASGGMSGGGAR